MWAWGCFLSAPHRLVLVLSPALLRPLFSSPVLFQVILNIQYNVFLESSFYPSFLFAKFFPSFMYHLEFHFI